MPLHPLDQLTIEAYLAALPKLTEPLPPELQAQFSAIEPSLIENPTEAAIATLRDLIEQHPPLATLYNAERLTLQSADRQRNKFLSTTPAQFTGWQSQPQTPPVHPAVTPSPDNVHPSATNGSVHETVDTMPQNGQEHPSGSNPSERITKPRIRRFVLALHASSAERDYYQTYIQELQRLNPDWIVLRDRPEVDESEAHVMIYNDPDQRVEYAAYLATRMIDSFVHRVADRYE